eukprot:2531443-Pleurochrysis_carterae.AAC.1
MVPGNPKREYTPLTLATSLFVRGTVTQWAKSVSPTHAVQSWKNFRSIVEEMAALSSMTVKSQPDA